MSYLSYFKEFNEGYVTFGGGENGGRITGKETIYTDGKVKLVSKASIRRHLKLEDSDGISTFPNTEIFEQLALMGSPTHTHVANEAASIGVDVRHRGAATTVSSLDIGQGCEVQGRHEQEIKFETEDISTAKTLVYIRRSASKDKGKGIMTEFEPKQTTTKLQQRQERVGYEAAVRLQEQLDEEEMQRITRVHEEDSSLNINEWENSQATIKADEELALRIQAEERGKYSEAKKARLLLKRLSFDELKNLFEATMKRVKKTFTSMESDVDRTIPKIADESSKRAAEEELEQESSKRQKTGESSEPREKDDVNLTQKDLQQMMMIVPVKEVYVESLQVKYLIID
nr:hypothetical protein [Tanacetum cinerariifolium]